MGHGQLPIMKSREPGSALWRATDERTGHDGGNESKPAKDGEQQAKYNRLKKRENTQAWTKEVEEKDGDVQRTCASASDVSLELSSKLSLTAFFCPSNDAQDSKPNTHL